MTKWILIGGGVLVAVLCGALWWQTEAVAAANKELGATVIKLGQAINTANENAMKLEQANELAVRTAQLNRERQNEIVKFRVENSDLKRMIVDAAKKADCELPPDLRDAADRLQSDPFAPLNPSPVKPTP